MAKKTQKSFMAVILVLAMMISNIPAMTLMASAVEGVSPSTSLPGSGTDAAPFEIASSADLAYMRDQINTGGTITPRGGGGAVSARKGYYKVTADIVLGFWLDDDGDGIVEDGEIYDSASGGAAYTESNWTPIGTQSSCSFLGVFDGDGHAVSGVYINEPTSNYQGLFGYVSNGTVKNVGVKDSYIKGMNSVGGVAGYNAGSGGKVENCYHTGSVSGKDRVGGITGYNNGTIQHCYKTGSVSGINYVGGILGENVGTTSGGKLLYCFNVGSVSGTDYLGGIAGINRAVLQCCYNTGSVSGNNWVGGITGYNSQNTSKIQYCYNTGSISGSTSVGGVAGANNGTATLTGCYYDKQVCPIGGSSGNDREGMAEGKLTSEMTNGAAFTDWSSGDTGIWNFTADLYPRLTGYVNAGADYKIDETDAALVSASPVFLAATDTATAVKNDFTLSTANDVSWASSDENVVSIDGDYATVEGDGSTTLTASLRCVTKSVSLMVDTTPPVLQNTVCDSDTQITVALSEPCLNLAKENDGGFTVTKTGTEETFAVSGTAQGADASHVVLTVADIAAAKAKGVTVTYTAGANGTITDIAGNLLATESIVISPWAPKLGMPGSIIWDTANPAKATWGAVENASGYTVQLYKDGIASGSPVTGITNTFYDFTSNITETGLYTFTVTAVRDDTEYLDSNMSSQSSEYPYVDGPSLAGLGTAAAPFEIASAADLAYMRDQVNVSGTITPRGGGAGVTAKTAHYKLTADTVLGYWKDDGDGIVEDGEIYDSESGGTAYSTSNWTPIGIGPDNCFSGTFNGDSYRVSGIYIKETSGWQGLFGYLRDEKIKDVGVKDSYIKGGSSNVGGIAGTSYYGTLSGCYYMGSVSGGTGGVGGIVGANLGTIQNCYNTGSVNGINYVGGVAGINQSGTIKNSYNTGSVSGTGAGASLLVGGVVGGNPSGTIENCYNTGIVSGTDYVGGVAGNNSSTGTIKNSYNSGSVNGVSRVGGVVGTNTGSTVQNCYYDKQMCTAGGINGSDVAGNAEGKLTSELTNGTAFSGWSSGDTGIWNFISGLYPRLTGYVDAGTDYNMDETDAALVSASPVFLAATDTAVTVKSDFTVSTANGVSWASGGGEIISIDGNNATVKGDGSATLIASLRGVTKSVSLTVDITPPILQNAVRDSGTQITVTLSEPCLNLTKENDGGFVVTKTGTEETYAVSETVQGADASHVVLTVDNMAAAGVKGITVTYTAGVNGTITDIAGNPLATNSIGVVISPWAPKLGTPVSLIWDAINPAKATWRAVENASGYTAQLYKDGIASGSPLTGIIDIYYDFSTVITETGIYTFTVKAISDGATYFDSDVSSKSPEYSYTVPVYISEAGINMVAPAAGASPQTAEQIETATSNADYTVTDIIWHEALTAGDRFKSGQVYTATVTLTSKNGKEFQAAPFTPTVESASSVETTTAAGTGTGNKVTFTVTFASTEAQSMTAISVTTQPDKMTYTECKDGILNLEGMVVTETYNDGTTKEITFEDGTATGYATLPANGAVLTNPINNGNPVTITHTESGKTAATDNLTVNMPPTYTVTFKSWNGSELKTETVEHGSGAIAPAEPTREGYHFTGWDADFSNVTSDLTVTATFAINKYTLTYTAGANGSITGAATQTVSHGSDGTAMTAVPDTGYHFVKWSDNVTTATRTDENVTGNITVTASFALNKYTLTYTAGANGSITGTATQTVSHGSDGTAVTAVPDTGYHFVKWSDNVTTATRTDENVTGNITVTASFALNKYTLTYTAGANGSITGTATQTVSHGSDGTAVTAVPDEGYHFVKWSDDVTTATRTDENVTGNITVTATFAKTEITAITVKTQPTKLTYTAGETLDLAGLEATISYNDGTSEDIMLADFGDKGIVTDPVNGATLTTANTGTPVILTCNSKTTMTNNLTVNPIILNSVGFIGFEFPATGGTPIDLAKLSPSKPGYTLTSLTWLNEDGSEATLTTGGKFKANWTYKAVIVMKAESEYKFAVSWPDTFNLDEEGKTLTQTITNTTAALAVSSISVTTQPDKMTYTEGKDGILTLEGMVVTETFNDGTIKTITFEDGTATGYATLPANGAVLTNPINNGNPVTITHTESGKTAATDNLTVNMPPTYTVTFKSWNGSGLKTETVEHGSGATAPTEPTREGYHFTGWDADFSNVTSDLTVTATFAINKYTLTYTAGANGSITGTATQSVSHGSDGTAVTAVPDTGYHFVKWSDNVTTATRTDENVTGDIAVTATFAINKYTLTYTAGANGSITGTATQSVSHGSDGTAVTAVPDTGYHFVKWSDDVTTATRTDTGVTGNISVTSEFAINTYTVTFKNWNGSGLKTETVEHGSGATAPTEPTREGYHFTGWDADFSNVTSDLTVTATFAINKYTLTYTAGANGSITGTATQSVSHGSDGTAMTAVPDTGYHFVKWSDNVTTATRTDKNITSEITVTATFAKTEITAITVKTQPTKLTYTAGETLDLAGLIATLIYNDGSAVDVAYAQFEANGITANPGQGTTMEVAIHNGQAIILTCITHTTTSGDLTVNAAPTYAINLSETGTYTFAALTVGYTPVAPITVTVTKTGTGNITNLSAALSGIDADDFTLGALDMATLDSITTSAEFTMKSNDALAPGTYTATVTVTADNGVSQSFNIYFTVNAPSAPTIQSAAAGDTHVNITWSSVPGATGYKIYQSIISGSYGATLATVSDSVYNYDVAGLSNGITYFFVVRANIGIYDSVNSNEISSTPQVPAPGAPVLRTAVAGDGHVNLTWSEVKGSIGYKIYASTISGSYTSPVDTVIGSVYSCDVTELNNGTAYYFVVTASNPGGDSGYSNEISATPQVLAPSAPTGLTATGENGKVTLSWNSTAEAAGYKIYQSEASGSYRTALTTVAESVYSYEITGLTNGMVYYFVIKATNAGGDSPYSSEITATPVTVPGAPTEVEATAGNGQVTVSFTPPADKGGSTITGYTVTSNPGNFTAAGIGTTITVTGLSNGTAYTFTVTASNAVGTGPASEASNAATPYRRSSADSMPSTPPGQPADTGVDILVNGKTETAATATTTQEGGKTIIAIVVDDKKVEKRLEQEGNNAVVTIPVMSGADVVIGTLNGQTVKNMESKDAVLEIKTGQVIYTLPASQINIDAVSEQIGKQVELKDIAVSVKISEPAEDTVKIVEDTADKNNYQIIIKPIEFEITCSSGSKTVEVSKFSAYVERMIAIPDGVDPSKITTGVILNSDGTFSHVPTAITMIDGKYYAKINSLTNSTYLLIYSPKAFKDVGKHWAEKEVNDMASRLVVSGIGDDKFEPDRDITRAEFAAIVVRALGLMSPGSGKDAFIDVMKKNWYYDAVSIAYEYGIISGYGNGKFGPDDKLTREQAMTMIGRAMKITGLKVELADGDIDKLLTSFTDANSAAEYAKANIASCVKAGIVSGRSGKLIVPKDNITRAEVAVIVQRLLRSSKLI